MISFAAAMVFGISECSCAATGRACQAIKQLAAALNAARLKTGICLTPRQIIVSKRRLYWSRCRYVSLRGDCRTPALGSAHEPEQRQGHERYPTRNPEVIERRQQVGLMYEALCERPGSGGRIVDARGVQPVHRGLQCRTEDTGTFRQMRLMQRFVPIPERRGDRSGERGCDRTQEV